MISCLLMVRSRVFGEWVMLLKKRKKMNKHVLTLLFTLSLTSLSLAQSTLAQVEPTAGNWKTWFIPSGKAYRLPAPKPAKDEVAEVLTRQQNLTPADHAQIQYWNTGAPGHRWRELMNELWMTDARDRGMLANMLLSVTTYDATVAAWDTKYAYNRPRPFAANNRIKALAPKPESPSYPCEHSVAAGVAVAIIAHFFPTMADSVSRMAERAMASRVGAGMAFPSDTRAGFELGKRIALHEIEQTKGYMFAQKWDGKIPEGPQHWTGTNPMFPTAGRSKTVVLTSGNQFRPGPPPDFTKDMAELKAFKPTFGSIANAFHFATESVWEDLLTRKVFEYNLHQNPPRAARIYALAAIGLYDGFVACWDAKYAYWGIRPEQLDPSFKPTLLASPPFPGYPSGHAAVGATMSELYSYFFPADKAYFQKLARQGAESRFHGGIHFRTDNEVALELGKKVGAAIVQKAQNDGIKGL